MGFGADQREALAECIDLINSGRSSLGEQLRTVADVVAFGRRYRVDNLGAARSPDLVRLRLLRSRLDSIALACEAADQQETISGLNALLAETGAVPQIVSHDGRGPHIHVSRASAPLADRIAAHCAMGLAELVVAGQSSRLRRCAAPECQDVFVDLSRNQSRCYCDRRTCGNRLHVAAYRARRSAATQAAATATATAPVPASSSSG
jgi:predicted RNA-binding Zn ribbon-like protein